MREIESRHPDMRFDWRQILDGQEEVGDDRDEVREGRADEVRERRGEGARDRRPASEPRPAGDADAALPAYAQLGPEGLARLRTRYGQVVAGIQRRVVDPAARKRLLSEAERLNPDRWGTPEDVKAALEQYETVHESLRRVVLGVRRRRRAPGEGQSGEGQATEERAAAPDDTDESPDAPESPADTPPKEPHRSDP